MKTARATRRPISMPTAGRAARVVFRSEVPNPLRHKSGGNNHLSYLSPVKSKKAAKLVGRGKRRTAEQSREWMIGFRNSCFMGVTQGR